MGLFGALYTRVMRWSVHPHAPRYLAALSFAESSFFPVPPDVMLAPMALATPARAWRYAAITTLASVVGGLFGYLIGALALEAVLPLIQHAGYGPQYDLVQTWFQRWGFWALFAAGFSPIPYKLFTIASGAVSMALPPFVLASLLGRGMRFFLVAGLMVWGGAPMQRVLLQYVDRIGWALAALAAVAYLVFRG